MTQSTKAPERIWLQDGGEWSDEAYFAGEITWCDSEVDSNDTEYVRADLLTAAEARAEAAEVERDRLAAALKWIINNPGAHPANMVKVAEAAYRKTVKEKTDDQYTD